MKHTPGPWTIENIDKIKGIRTKAGFICFLPSPFLYEGQDERYNKECEETKSNAKLIAAAPEMYEALKEMNNTAIRLADHAPEIYKNANSELFALIHNAHLKVKELLKKLEE